MQQQPISGSRPRPLRTTARGAILFQRDNGSALELVRFSLGSVELDTKSMAALFGAKLARW